MDLNPTLVRNVTGTWGAAGERWLAELPDLVGTLAREWDLELGDPYPLTYHWVAPVLGERMVLKVGFELASEAAALECFAGHGAVRLLRKDLTRGALLLERADPGTEARTLVPERDEEATAAIIDVARKLHTAEPSADLPRLSSLSGTFQRYRGPLPRDLVARAGGLFDELCDSATETVVLHGDLHHDNVLRAEREPWLAIDPHGWVGDPGYEVGALLYNPFDAPLSLVPPRIEQVADGLGLPTDRVVAWGFVMAVLSEVWTTEDGGPPDGHPLDVAISLLPRL
jgi:streptomycin 6-kinase